METLQRADPGDVVDTESRSQILIIEDEETLLPSYLEILTAAGHCVKVAANDQQARELVLTESFEVIVSDISLPGLDGLALLRTIRARDLDVPVILITDNPLLSTINQAFEYGAFCCLSKPLNLQELVQVIGQARLLYRMARLRRESSPSLGSTGSPFGDRSGLEVHFEHALKQLWMAYQPIISVPDRSIVAYEALVRSGEPTMPHPGLLLDAAERTGRLYDLGWAIRGNVASTVLATPDVPLVYINLHPRDLLDERLYQTHSAFSRIALKVVLEIPEQASLGDLRDIRSRISKLKNIGFRIAVGDLGAGHGGMAAVANLEPEVIKIDMSLVRNVHAEPTKQRLIRSILSMCAEMNIQTICEGVETPAERDTLLDLGGTFQQGFLYARPALPFLKTIDF